MIFSETLGIPNSLRTAAILAGGLATRLRPLTEKTPKALLPVSGEPFIAHQLRLLLANGIERVVLCIGHLGEAIREFVGDGSRLGIRVSYSMDGPTLRGTGGAIAHALPLLDEAFFVVYGDSYLPCPYGSVAEGFRQSGQPGLMTVYHNEGRWDASNVEFVGGRILAYDKVDRTPSMHHIDYGLGAFHRDVFADLPETGAYELSTVYQRLLQAGRLAAFEVKERFYEIGSPEGLRGLSALLNASRGHGNQ
jgi:NDP-sugar pyrophosphorylase family protein